LAAWRIEQALTQAAVAQVVPLQSAGGPEAEAARTASAASVARDLRTELVVTGEYYRRGDSLEVVAHVLRPASEQVLYDLPGVRGDPQDPVAAFEVVAQQVAGAVAVYVGLEGQMAAEHRTPPPNLEVLRLAGEAWELFSLGEWEEVLALHRRMSQLDTTWVGHLLMESGVLSNLGRLEEADSIHRYLDARRDRLTRLEHASLDWMDASVNGDLSGEYRAVQEMVSLDPIGQAYAAAYTCDRTNRLEEALEYIARRDTTTMWGQNWAAWDRVHFTVLVRLGRLEEALEVASRNRATRPDYWPALSQEARVMAAMGRRAEVEALLREAREYPTAEGWSPGELVRNVTLVAAGTGHQEDAAHYADLALAALSGLEADTRYLRARLLAYAERWEEAELLFRELLEEDPDNLAVTGYLGWVMAQQGKSGEAESLHERIGSLDRRFSTKGLLPYWQAAISAGLGDHERAVNELEQALSTGWVYTVWTIWYPWFRPLHDHPRYQRLIAPK
jgi:tetratricopeptide (TPR) repeat protein